jgi:hypothetical protein
MTLTHNTWPVAIIGSGDVDIALDLTAARSQPS